jgi:hypothetical protein
MSYILSYSPGQTVTVYLETKNSDGYYADGYYGGLSTIDGYELPTLHRMILPDLTLDGYYPQPMTKLDTGIYCYRFTLPTGAPSVGTYFVDLAYREPTSGLEKFLSYLINVSAPYGLYSTTSF